MRRISTITRVVNGLLRPTLAGRRDPGKAFDRLVANAAEASGGSPTEEIRFLQDFADLLRDFAAVEGLTPIGWLSATGDIQARIENRLRIGRLHHEHPELARERIERPIVIVGLPRTATTLTHNIIARSEDHRGPLLWEWMHTDLPQSPDEERRIIRRVDRAMRTVLRLAPAFWAIHPQSATRPDEDPFILPHGAQHLARAPLPAYEQRLLERDWGPDYDYLVQALQVLQHGRPPKRWVLKSPTHLENLDQLVRVFPDCSIVWMHRDPATVLGSICSLVETSTLLHVRRPDLEAIGQMCLRLTRRLVDRARAARPGIAPGRIIDVPYDWLVADPRYAMPVVYEHLGAQWTAADADALDGVLARPRPRRFHEYTLDRYGLDESAVHDAFGDYGQFASMPGPGPRHHRGA